MPWLILTLSAVCEAIWATALARVDGFSRLGPLGLFAITLTASMIGLSWTAARIPVGTAYAVWTGVGAALTVGYSVVSGAATLSVWRVVLLTGIIAGAAGLKFTGDKAAAPIDSDAPGTTVDNLRQNLLPKYAPTRTRRVAASTVTIGSDVANIKDVAQQAGVSMTTVSHVLNGRGRIAEKTRTRVLEAAAQLGYTANPHAQQLVTRRSRILVIQMPDLDCDRPDSQHGVAVVPTSESEYFLELINGAAAAAAAAKYALIVMSSGVDPSSMGGFGVDGMIIVDPKGTEEVLQPTRPVAYPVVTTGEPVVATGATGFVIDNDHREATRRVMDHFTATGRTRPALIVDTTARSYIRDIVQAYTEWCDERELVPAVVALSDMTPDQMSDALTSLRGRQDSADAVYTSSDGSAIALLDAARRAHISVPGELAIASAVDSSTLRVTNPPVTGMYLYPREIGTRAVQLVTELIERRDPDCELPPLTTTRQLIPTHLSVRGSSANTTDEATASGGPTRPTQRGRRRPQP